MTFLKRIQPLFLSFTLIACCLTFQSNATATASNTTYSSWTLNSIKVSSNYDVYKIKPRKVESILGNNFSIFNFKCFLKQSKNILATNHKQQNTLLLPQQPGYLKITPQTSTSEEEIIIG